MSASSPWVRPALDGTGLSVCTDDDDPDMAAYADLDIHDLNDSSAESALRCLRSSLHEDDQRILVYCL